MPTSLKRGLNKFAKDHQFTGKGPLSVALLVTQHARDKGLPLDPNALVTRGGGQVRRLGKSGVQSVLKQHGIDRVLASEGGRTSRGSLNKMRAYVAFLNDLYAKGRADFDEIEKYWITRVHAFFAAKPFKIKLDASRGLRHVVRDILAQAVARQKDAPGMSYAGAVLQHLVGAKLDCALGLGKIKHHSFSAADAPGSRPGDFSLGDVAIHVTTAPSEAVIERCRANLDAGYKPILVTIRDRVVVAEGLADNKGLAERVDIFEIEQFVALNLYELAKFEASERRVAVDKLIRQYNKIVADVETDPSLGIEVR